MAFIHTYLETLAAIAPELNRKSAIMYASKRQGPVAVQSARALKIQQQVNQSALVRAYLERSAQVKADKDASKAQMKRRLEDKAAEQIARGAGRAKRAKSDSAAATLKERERKKAVKSAAELADKQIANSAKPLGPATPVRLVRPRASAVETQYSQASASTRDTMHD